jgi:hypothetical protein
MYYILTVNYSSYQTQTTSLEFLQREAPDLTLKDVLGGTVARRWGSGHPETAVIVLGASPWEWGEERDYTLFCLCADSPVVHQRFSQIVRTREDAENLATEHANESKRDYLAVLDEVSEDLRHLVPSPVFGAAIREVDGVILRYTQRGLLEPKGDGVMTAVMVDLELPEEVYRKNPEKYRKPPKSCGKILDLSRPVEMEILSE